MSTPLTEPQVEARAGARRLNWLKRALASRHLPWVLALAAFLVMWPAVNMGLGLDDLVQRLVELKPSQLPTRIYDTGIPEHSGTLSTVLTSQFPGLGQGSENVAKAVNYGVLPWWTPKDLSLALWRPLTAFSHWVDYQLFPNSPRLMHLHNIAWFAGVIFFATVMYRKLMGPGWAAGLAAVLLLLDVFFYFPVMFVANRGFVLSLCCGLVCLHEHHRWRSSQSRSASLLSALCLALALFANEGGASTLAFLLAYALVLEPGSWRSRALSLVPALGVLVVWRMVYTLSGFGIHHLQLYIDPANEPLAYARVVIPRFIALLGGQLTGAPPEILLAVKPSLHPVVIALYGLAVLAALLIFLPCVRRNKAAAFWLVVMLLAAIPAATVAPISKNLGFVAVGAYGVLASCVADLFSQPRLLPQRWLYRGGIWAGCLALLFVHGPVAVAARIGMAGASYSVARPFVTVDTSPEAENQDVVTLNAPLLLVYAPFYKVYEHQPLPRTLRNLVPGCTAFEVKRTDEKTLVVRSREPDIFACDYVRPVNGLNVMNACNRIGVPEFKRGDEYHLRGLTVEVLEADAAKLPSQVVFRFDTSLDAPSFHWLFWDWRRLSYKPFQVPAVGESVMVPGPRSRKE